MYAVPNESRVRTCVADTEWLQRLQSFLKLRWNLPDRTGAMVSRGHALGCVLVHPTAWQEGICGAKQIMLKM